MLIERDNDYSLCTTNTRCFNQYIKNNNNYINDFNVITEAEMALYSQVNDTTAVYPEKSIVDMFYNTVTQFPNRIALSSREGTLTYEELNKKVIK